MITEDYTTQLLDHLHRGGTIAHYWTPNTGEFYIHNRTGEQIENSWSIWFDVDNRKSVPDAWINKNVYFSVNPSSQSPDTYKSGAPVRQRTYTKTRVKYVNALNCVFAEFDVKDWGDKESIKEHLMSLPVYPSVVIDSGGGYHCYWLLDDTVSVGDDNRRHIQQVCYAWVDLVQGDPDAKDLARVLRLPGYKNRKSVYAPDYPIVYFVETDFDSVYSFAQIEELTAHLRKERKKRSAAKSSSTTYGGDLIMAIDCLNRLDSWRCDDYDTWLHVGMALRSLGDKGLELWDDWSQKSDSYEDGCCDAKWDTFDDSGVGLGSLRHWADEDDPDGAKIAGGVEEMAEGFSEMEAGQTLPLAGDESTSTTAANNNVLMVAELVKVAAQQPTAQQQILALNGIKNLIGDLTASERRSTVIIDKLCKIFPSHTDRERFLDECGDPVATNTLLSYATHDQGNALCVIERHGGKFCYNDAFGWLYHNGTHWTNEGAESAVGRAITETLEARMAAAIAAGSSQYGQIIKDCLPNHRKVNGIKGQLRDAVDCPVGAFDNDPDLLNCNNGVVNLRTGEIAPHNTTQRFMYCVPVDYKQDADYSNWVEWLTSVTNKDDADWLQLAQGYSITGHTREEILMYIWGKTRSGKGTYESTIRKALGGTLAKSVQFSTFTTDRGKDDQNFDLAPLKSARFIAASESKQHERFNEAKVKQITGGDEIHCAFKHKNFFNYVPQFKIWLFSNFPVNADPDDDAVWGRIRVIEFPHSHLGQEDKTLKERMHSTANLEAVLAWAIQGAMRWYALGNTGLPELESNAVKKQEQRNELDTVQMWIDQECERIDGQHEQTSVLYQSYEGWCKESGTPPKQRKGFTQTLDRKGYTSGREYIDIIKDEFVSKGGLPSHVTTQKRKQCRVIYGLGIK